MDDSSSRWDPRLGPLMDQLLQHIRAGNDDAVEEACSKHPELEAQVRSYVELIHGVEGLAKPPEVQDAEEPDQTLGEYILRKQIGRGGMGVVYQAYHPKLDRHVAIKVLPKFQSSDPNLVARFQLEARAIARLKHEHIVGVYDIGEDLGQHFLAMQLIDGIPLTRLIQTLRDGDHVPTRTQLQQMLTSHICGEDISKSDDPDSTGASETSHHGDESWSGSLSQYSSSGRWSLKESSTGRFDYYRWCAGVVSQLADALGYAHQNGVVHRDVKPSNILIDRNGRVWVADFGLAKIDESDLTKTGDVVGTMRYMAPERLNGWCDPRSDLFSLGLTLYELVAFYPAFSQQDATGLFASVQAADIPPVSRVRPNVPRDLETIIHKSLECLPERRYQTAHEFAADLDCFLAGRPIKARRSDWLERSWLWCRRQPVLASLLALTVFSLLAVAIVSTWSAWKMNEQLIVVQKANELADQRLLASYWTQLESTTREQASGNRIQSLSTIGKTLPLVEKHEPQQRKRLRNLAIRALTLFDTQEGALNEGRSNPDQSYGETFDKDIKRRVELKADGTLAIVELQSGTVTPVRGVELEYDSWMIDMSRDGRYAFVSGRNAGQGVQSLIDMEAAKTVFELTSDSSAYAKASFSQNSQRISFISSRDQVKNDVFVRDCRTGEIIFAHKMGQTVCYGTDLSRNGKSVLVSRIDGFSVFDVETGEQLANVPISTSGQRAVFGCNEQFVWVYKPGGVCERWSRVGTEYQLQVSVPSKSAQMADRLQALDQRSLCILTTSRNETRLWDPQTECELLTLDYQNCQLAEDGSRIGFVNSNGDFGFLNVVAPKSFMQLKNRSDANGVIQIEISPSGHEVFVLDQRSSSVGMFSLLTGELVGLASSWAHRFGVQAVEGRPNTLLDTRRTADQGPRLHRLQFEPDSSFPSGLPYEAESEQIETTGLEQNLTSACIPVGGDRWVVMGSATVFWCQSHSGNSANLALRETGRFSLPFVHGHFDFAPNTKLLAIGTHRANKVVILDVENGRQVFQFDDSMESAESTMGATCQFSPDGKTLVIQTSSRCLVFDTTTWNLMRSIERDTVGFGGIAMSEQWLAIGEGAEIRILDRKDYREVCRLSSVDKDSEYHAERSSGMPAFKFSSYDGRLLAGTTGRTTTIWDLKSLNQELEELGLAW